MPITVRHRLATLIVVLTATQLDVIARQPPAADAPIDAAVRREVIDGALKLLTAYYVFPDRTPGIEQAIRSRQENREYDNISTGRALAQTLTAHLREVSKDQHLEVTFSATPLPPQQLPAPGQPLTPETQAVFDRQTLAAARQNFGFAKVERLAGNIGYMEVRNFPPVAVAGDTAAAAFAFLANTDALIVDVRNNGGGQPGMVAFVTSYFFVAPTHLNDVYNRLTGETRQSWTLPYVPGKRFTGKDVYILTSPRTFSAGEEFAYNLKHLKRAAIIGENTEGGAHLVTPRRITDHFTMAVPVGRPINPVTKSNWEATGVDPDVRVSSEDALTTAHLRALEAQQQRLPPDAIMLRNEVASAIAALKTQQSR